MMAKQTTKPMYSLKAVLANVISIEDDLMFNRFILDSREVTSGDIFLAWRGSELDASYFINDAINNGAVAVLVDTDCAYKIDSPAVPVIEIESLKQKAGEIVNQFYGDVTSKINVVGVTGTNGKTSIAHAIAACMSDMQTRTGLIGTLGNGIYPAIKSSQHTTPDVLSLHELFYSWHNDVDMVAMEVSSHALDQYRVSGIDFDIAVFSSFSRDHLDYHETMDEYFQAKQRLFNEYDIKHAVINIGDEKLRKFTDSLLSQCEVWSYELLTDEESFVSGKNVIQAKTIKNKNSLTRLEIQSPWGNVEIAGNWLADFVCENILAVFTVLCLSGKSISEASEAISRYAGVPGRMQSISLPSGAIAVIDYAHTPVALEKALKNLKSICNGELHCIFGCGGDRDQGKRKLMGYAADKYADRITLTNDNPRSEDPISIIQDIVQGIEESSDYAIETDRAEAIEMVCHSANENDIILIAGKGHENYQVIGSQRYPFSDIECVKRLCEDAL